MRLTWSLVTVYFGLPDTSYQPSFDSNISRCPQAPPLNLLALAAVNPAPRSLPPFKLNLLALAAVNPAPRSLPPFKLNLLAPVAAVNPAPTRNRLARTAPCKFFEPSSWLVSEMLTCNVQTLGQFCWSCSDIERCILVYQIHLISLPLIHIQDVLRR
jgi:hypothetical protein